MVNVVPAPPANVSSCRGATIFLVFLGHNSVVPRKNTSNDYTCHPSRDARNEASVGDHCSFLRYGIGLSDVRQRVRQGCA